MSSWEYILEIYNSLFMMNEVKLHGIFCVTFVKMLKDGSHFINRSIPQNIFLFHFRLSICVAKVLKLFIKGFKR